MNAPAVVIRLELEAAPLVLTDAATEGQASWLADWILSQPDLAELVDRALLSREERLRAYEQAA
jgi:hypothetical protein